MIPFLRASAALAIGLALGCGSSSSATHDAGPSSDATAPGKGDAGKSADAHDAMTGHTKDASKDGSAVDAGGRDTGVDAGADTGAHDAGQDASHDAGQDAGHDAGEDAGHDAGPMCVNPALDCPTPPACQDAVCLASVCSTVPRSPGADCPNGTCNATGSCLLINGQPCGVGSACISNECVSGYCCGNACTGTCVACSQALTGHANGVCAPMTPGSTAPSGQCLVTGICGNDGNCNSGGGCEQISCSQGCLANILPSCTECATANPSDKPICEQYLQCYNTNDCNPNNACGEGTGTCGPSTIGGGSAPAAAALATYNCACP